MQESCHYTVGCVIPPCPIVQSGRNGLNSAIMKIIVHTVDICLKFPVYIDIGRSIQILWLMVKFERSFWKQWPIYVLSVCLYFPKKSLLTNKTRKMPFSLFPRPNNTVSNKFTLFMYGMNQYTYSVSRVCTPTAWIFNKLSKSKQEPVCVQWSYCWRGARVIETPLYEYWPDRRFINLIVMPLLLYGI